MNYFFLNTNFALKFQEKSWKDDVVTFTAHLSVTILQCLTRYTGKHKVILAAMLADTNHNTLPKNQSALKYLPSCVSSQILGVRYFLGALSIFGIIVARSQSSFLKALFERLTYKWSLE